jgi:hypothetical protein
VPGRPDPFATAIVLGWVISGAVAVWTWLNELAAARQDHAEVKASKPVLESSIAATRTELYCTSLFTLMAFLFLGVGVASTLFGSPPTGSPSPLTIMLRVMLTMANVALATAGALQRPGRDELIRALKSERKLVRRINDGG